MVGIEQGWPRTLLVELLMRNHDNDVAAGSYERPPLGQRFLNVAHVLQAMRAMNAVKAFWREIGQQILSITVLDIKWYCVRHNHIRPTPNVYYTSGKISISKIIVSQLIRFCSFVHNDVVKSFDRWQCQRSMYGARALNTSSTRISCMQAIL